MTNNPRARSVNIGFRCTPKERELIERRMAQTGIKSLRAYLLKMAIDGRVIRVELDSVNRLLAMLSDTTDAINRLSQSGSVTIDDIERLHERCDGLWAQTKLILRKIADLV